MKNSPNKNCPACFGDGIIDAGDDVNGESMYVDCPCTWSAHLSPGSLWQAPEGIYSAIAPNATLELTRVERGASGEVLALTFVPFTGDPIRLVLLPETKLQSIGNVSSALDVL